MEKKQPEKHPPLLSREHFETLVRGSGISDEVINERKYRTITEPKELRELGFNRQQSLQVPGLLIPVHCTDGSNGMVVYRPDIPRSYEDRKSKRNPDGTYKWRVIKYELPPGTSMRVDCPFRCRRLLADPKIPLWITEGQKKADALASKGVCAIDLLGVWNFKSKNKDGGITFNEVDFDFVGLNDRDVRIVFDSDVMVKPEVRAALDRFTKHLQQRQAHVSAVYLPMQDGQKVGVDDYLLIHTINDLEGLIEGPRPKLKPSGPVVRQLKTAPLTIRRPLALIAGRAYAGIWPWLEITRTEEERGGDILKFETPQVQIDQPLFIMRDDGRIFGGEGADESMETLGIIPSLREIPKEELLWSAEGRERYRAGVRPDAADVFRRITEVIDNFVDFDLTWGTQSDMCGMVGCYVLATWFLDAFNVIGYFWASGEPGSGKSTLACTVTWMSYLGQTLSSVSSIPTVRDFADYGGSLNFDDCDNLDERKDRDLFALLLAGNRRGNTITQKEQGPTGNWDRTRHVNTYCPRLFSSIRLPNEALRSRTIEVPLRKSIDKKRTDEDFAAVERWPHNREALIDDLWALALSNLASLKEYDAAIAGKTTLGGRALEPWRALLAVASWLDDQGVSGLWKRTHALALAYQGHTQERDSVSWPVLVLKALMNLVDKRRGDTLTLGDTSGESLPPSVRNAEIVEGVKQVVDQEDLTVKEEWITPDRMGRVMKNLGFQKTVVNHGRTRCWIILPSLLERMGRAYRLIAPPEVSPSVNVSPEPENRERVTI